MKRNKRDQIARIASETPGKILIYAYALLLIVPFYFIIVTAIKPEAEIRTNPVGLPTEIAWSNFIDAIMQGNLIKAFLNSAVVAVSGTALRVVFDLIIVFCIFKLMNYRTGKVIYIIIIASMFIPGTGWITMIKLFRSIGLYDNLTSLIISGMVAGLPFNMIILLGFMEGIPRALNEAAEIDGCSDAQYMTRILVPVIKPAVISVGILSFTEMWNSLFTNLLLIRSESNYTLPQALLVFKATHSTIYSLMFAGVLFGSIPLIILYLACQKSFTSALTGSIKG